MQKPKDSAARKPHNSNAAQLTAELSWIRRKMDAANNRQIGVGWVQKNARWERNERARNERRSGIRTRMSLEAR
eukprot:1944327-Rhodomonas_salina.2